jgi:hypothetical protein
MPSLNLPHTSPTNVFLLAKTAVDARLCFFNASLPREQSGYGFQWAAGGAHPTINNGSVLVTEKRYADFSHRDGRCFDAPFDVSGMDDCKPAGFIGSRI